MLISFKHQREALHFDWLSSVSLARSIYKYGSPASRLLSQLQTYLLLLETQLSLSFSGTDPWWAMPAWCFPYESESSGFLFYKKFFQGFIESVKDKALEVKTFLHKQANINHLWCLQLPSAENIMQFLEQQACPQRSPKCFRGQWKG